MKVQGLGLTGWEQQASPASATANCASSSAASTTMRSFGVAPWYGLVTEIGAALWLGREVERAWNE
jgi:hypothetical protein